MIIGFLGAGQMAQTLARVWLPAGHQVLLANSRGPDSLAGLVAELGPAARAVTPPELTTADVVVLATRWVQTPDAVALVGPLTGTIVLDPTNNRVGPRPEDVIDLGGRLSSEVVAELVPGARLVRALYHLPIPALGTLREEPEPLALFVAGDDPAARSVVAGLLRDLGGEPVDLGTLADGARLQGAGGPFAGRGRWTAAETRAILAAHRSPEPLR